MVAPRARGGRLRTLLSVTTFDERTRAAAGFDVIGDVHGAAGPLVALLDRLGYRDHGRSRRHRDGRVAVFVGDLIDRGPGQVEVVSLVRAMVEEGDAVCVMGNHEYNAVAWARGLRRRDAHRRRQHAAFLDAVGEGSALHRDLVGWFAGLPVSFEAPGLRVVHACWDPTAFRDVSAYLVEGTLTDEGFAASSDRTRDAGRAHRAIEHLLKGPEIDLPQGRGYVDKDGRMRFRARYAWWHASPQDLAEACVIPSDVLFEDGTAQTDLAGLLPGPPPCPPYRDDVPVVVGHYWRRGVPSPLAVNVACVDYSAVRGGSLVAYRHDPGMALAADRFVGVAGQAS